MSVRAFDLIPILRARPKYQLSSLSSDTKLPHVSLLYLVWMRFFLDQPLFGMRSRGEPLLTTLKVVTA